MTPSWMSPDSLLITWLLAPYVAAFLAVLLPSLSHALVVLCCGATAWVGAEALIAGTTRPLQLLGEFGVPLSLEPLAAWFVLLNGLVCLAVWIEARRQSWDRTGWMLLLVLLGSLNTSFLTTDLISLYVALEVVGITAFLLILKGKSTNASWIALRYLLIGNTTMAIYFLAQASHTPRPAVLSLRPSPSCRWVRRWCWCWWACSPKPGCFSMASGFPAPMPKRRRRCRPCSRAWWWAEALCRC